MSASLVGSEMCIRDRRKGPGKRPAKALGDQTLTTPGQESELWRGVMAVSYTHLTLPTICSV
eukprot:9619188-Alexandrium_andersonii.AAC.1